MKTIALILLLLLPITVFADTVVKMPSENVELFRQSYVFPWRFYDKFGWFPDRDGSVLNARDEDWWLKTVRELTEQEKSDIYDFAKVEANFELPDRHRIVDHIDYVGLMNRINDYIKNNHLDLKIMYIGHGEYQFIYVSRDLTSEEFTAIKNLRMNYITYE